METAYIETTAQINPLGIREAVNHEWKGESPYVRISRDLLDEIVGVSGDASKVQIGPYKLLRVDDQPWDFTVLYVRAEKFGALRVVLYRSTRLLDLIYRRMIITLAVWKLADYSPARIPSWRDIHLFKRWL